MSNFSCGLVSPLDSISLNNLQQAPGSGFLALTQYEGNRRSVPRQRKQEQLSQPHFYIPRASFSLSRHLPTRQPPTLVPSLRCACINISPPPHHPAAYLKQLLPLTRAASSENELRVIDPQNLARTPAAITITAVDHFDMASASPSRQICSRCDDTCQTWRGRGKQPAQDQSPGEPAVDSVHDGADEEQAQGSIDEGAEDENATNGSVSYARRTWQHVKKDHASSPKIPRTSIGILRTPPTSRQATPRTSRQATPHTSGPGTPRASRPATPYNSVASSLSAGYQAHMPLISRWSGPPGHLPSTPPISRAKAPGYTLTSRPRAPGQQLPSFPPSTRLNAHALRHARSSPHLTKRQPLSPLPTTWPPTTTETALTRSSQPSRTRAYTHPPRLFLKTATAIRKPSTTTNLTTTTTPVTGTGTTPRQHIHSSICIHTSLFLYHSRSSQAPKLVPSGRRYRCACKWSKQATLRSQLSFTWVDGAVQVAYPDAPEKAEWCYCSGGEGHVVADAGEAVRMCAEEKERGVVVREVGVVGREGKGRLSEGQREEMNEAEWGGTKKALRKQRDCLWLRGRVRRWMLCIRLRRVVEKRS